MLQEKLHCVKVPLGSELNFCCIFMLSSLLIRLNFYIVLPNLDQIKQIVKQLYLVLKLKTSTQQHTQCMYVGRCSVIFT